MGLIGNIFFVFAFLNIFQFLFSGKNFLKKEKKNLSNNKKTQINDIKNIISVEIRHIHYKQKRMKLFINHLNMNEIRTTLICLMIKNTIIIYLINIIL